MTRESQVLHYPTAERRSLRRVWSRLADCIALRTAWLAPSATGFVFKPEPKFHGEAALGLQLLDGHYFVRGNIHEKPGSTPWGLKNLDADQLMHLHGFTWLDDVAAVDTPEARAKVQAWVFDWMERYGRGRTEGWAADLVGQRVIWWINHAILILHEVEQAQSELFFRSLSHQARFLRKRWKSVRPGLRRFEALTGLVYSGLLLQAHGDLFKPALKLLGRECAREIGVDGSISSRNPEELAKIFILLSWVNQVISDQKQTANSEILLALERLTPAIRALRLGDGSMAQFHGGATGQPGRVDQALADVGIRNAARIGGSMGYSRLSALGTVLVMDTGKMPAIEHLHNAHAGVLSFEMSSGRMPVLVNMGPAHGHMPKVKNESRATSAHNASVLDKTSSARFIGNGRALQWIAVPSQVTMQKNNNEFGQAILAQHDGYRQSHGLIHERQLALVHAGNEVQGEERFFARTTAQRVRFGGRADEKGKIPFETHFHVHPDAHVTLLSQGSIASIVLQNDEYWFLRSDGNKIELRDTIFIEQGRIKPRATQEIVVMGFVVNYEGRISWTLTRQT